MIKQSTCLSPVNDVESAGFTGDAEMSVHLSSDDQISVRIEKDVSALLVDALDHVVVIQLQSDVRVHFACVHAPTVGLYTGNVNVTDLSVRAKSCRKITTTASIRLNRKLVFIYTAV